VDQPVRYSTQAREAINAYLKGITNDLIAVTAAEELLREFKKLARNPGLGTGPTGPFETRPLHKFYVESGDRRRLVHVSYRPRGNGQIDILAFSAVPV
jgi:plasmid stabilization system protein ParE